MTEGAEWIDSMMALFCPMLKMKISGPSIFKVWDSPRLDSDDDEISNNFSNVASWQLSWHAKLFVEL